MCWPCYCTSLESHLLSVCRRQTESHLAVAMDTRDTRDTMDTHTTVIIIIVHTATTIIATVPTITATVLLTTTPTVTRTMITIRTTAIRRMKLSWLTLHFMLKQKYMFCIGPKIYVTML